MQQLGDYKLIEKIGAGGMGEVWRGENVHTHLACAVKLLPMAATQDGNFVARFFDEGRVMQTLKHPNIVPVHHVGHDKESGRYYLVMDFVAGADGVSQSLHDLLQASADNRLPEADVRKWAVQIAEGLAYAHKQGIVHRDIKPANILIDADNNAQIADFGLAKAVGDEYIQTQIHQSIQHSMAGSLGDQPTILNASAERKRSSGSRPIEGTLDGLDTIQPGQSSIGTHRSTAESILGTYDYMSPEQRNELPGTPVGPPSDIYAYGVMVYRLLTGRRPTGRVKPVSQTVPGLSKNWDALSYRCLEHQPEDRYPDGTDLLADLNRFRSSRSGKGLLKVACGLIVLMVIVAGSVIGYQKHEVRQQERSEMDGKKRVEGNSAAATAAGRENPDKTLSVDAYVYKDGYPAAFVSLEKGTVEPYARGMRRVSGDLWVEPGDPEIKGLVSRFEGIVHDGQDVKVAVAPTENYDDLSDVPDGLDWQDGVSRSQIREGLVFFVHSSSGRYYKVRIDRRDNAKIQLTYRRIYRPSTRPNKIENPKSEGLSLDDLGVASATGRATDELFPLPSKGGPVSRERERTRVDRRSAVPARPGRGTVPTQPAPVTSGPKLPPWKPGECIRTLSGHTKPVRSVSFSPDGARAVSGSDDDTLKVWDLTTGKCLRTLSGHTIRVLSVSLSPDGARAVAGSLDATLKVWDLSTGKCLRTLSGHNYSVNSVSLSPDGARAVSGSYDKTLKVWDLSTGKCLRTLSGHKAWVLSVSISPDGARAVSGSDDDTLKVWDLTTGKCLRTLSGHTSSVLSVSLSPDGQRAVSGSSDRTLKVWDLSTGKCIRTLSGHTDWVRSVSFSPDGQRALSGGDDATLKVWDLTTGKCLRTLSGHTGHVNSVSVSPDSRFVLSGSGDGTVKLWDLGEPEGDK